MNEQDLIPSCSLATFRLGLLHCAKDAGRVLLNVCASAGAILLTVMLIDVAQKFYASTFDLPPWYGFDYMQKAVASFMVALYLCCLWIRGEFDVKGFRLKTAAVYTVSFLVAIFMVVGLCSYVLWALDVVDRFHGFGWQPRLTTGENLGLVPLKLGYMLGLVALAAFSGWGIYSGIRQAIRAVCDKGNAALNRPQRGNAAE
jgi:hypothetical protein